MRQLNKKNPSKFENDLKSLTLRNIYSKKLKLFNYLLYKYLFPKVISVKVPPDVDEELETAPPEAAAAAAAHPDEPHVVEVEVEAWFIRLLQNVIQSTINDHIFLPFLP